MRLFLFESLFNRMAIYLLPTSAKLLLGLFWLEKGHYTLFLTKEFFFLSFPVPSEHSHNSVRKVKTENFKANACIFLLKKKVCGWFPAAHEFVQRL